MSDDAPVDSATEPSEEPEETTSSAASTVSTEQSEPSEPEQADETKVDLKPLPESSSNGSVNGKSSASSWSTPSEPAGSVFAGRTDTAPPPPRPMTPSSPGAGAKASGEYPSVVRAAARGTSDGKSPRKAHLQVSRFEPLSVMKFSFVMSLVCFVVLLVAVTVLYMILSGLGVFDSISSTINELTQEQGSKTNTLDAASWFSFTKIFGYTALIGGLNVLIITALATVWSVIYNIASDIVGGVEVTLKEAE